jgi:hypothetical protein
MATVDDTGADDVLDKSWERKLRGAALKGSDQKDAVDYAPRDPDTTLHLGGEEDTLYDDGLEIGDGSDTPMGTHGNF